MAFKRAHNWHSDEWSVAARSIRSDQKPQSFFVRISSFWNEVLQGRRALQIAIASQMKIPGVATQACTLDGL